ncbi:MAG: glycoside hydrolase family 5 protein, partial [Candidatus Dormibacteraeota bacterium]|nr:glycoside hydrolase family 5 protein [Candidatus Dormibacteraeota bacterium]
MSTHSDLSRSLPLRRLPRLLLLLLFANVLVPAILHAQGAGFWHTGGSRILDANDQQVRIAGINWYGFETTRGVAGGLTSQDYKSILGTIHAQGYNTIRIPLSNQVVESPQIPSSISYANGINSDLQGLNSLQILDRIVSYSGTLNLRVILDNHRSEAGDSAESNGLWFTGAYPESAWINDWTNLARRYAGNTTVIGVDLRNEPHNANSGGACWDCGGANDWHLAAQRAGNAVLAVNPNLLIFVEGTDAYNNDYYWWGGNLQGVGNSPVTLSIPNHLVYSPHEYGPREYQQWWFNGNTSYSSLYSVWNNHWGFINQNNIAPIWVGEFGTTNNASDIQNNSPGSQGQWFQSLIQFLGSDRLLNWTYWALNGEDAYGLLDPNYNSNSVSPLKQQSLASLQSPLGAGGGGSTPPPDPNFPAPPTNVAATAASSSQINLGWQASSTTGVVYQIYASTTANFAASSSTVFAQNIAATSFQATGLS